MLPSILDLKPSRQLRYWTLGIHLFAAVLILLLPLTPLLKSLFVVVTLTGLWLQYKKLFLTPKNIVRAIYIQNPESWRLKMADGGAETARLEHSIVFPRLIVLYLRRENGKIRSLLIPRDALPADQHRRLRAALRLQKPPGSKID